MADGYVPEYTPGAVAAGGAGIEGDAGGVTRLRRFVPTTRQATLHGTATETSFSRVALFDRVKPSLGTRFMAYVNAINPSQIEGPTVIMVVFGLQALLGQWDTQVLSIGGPEISATFGVSPSTFIALTSFLTGLGYALGIPAGYIADRARRVTLVRISAITHQVATIAKVFLPSYGTFIATDLAAGVISLPGSAAGGPLVADYFPSRSRARAQGFIGWLGTLGGLISPVIIGWMIVRYGWRSSLALLAIPSFLTACLVFLMREPVRGAMDRMEMGVSREVAAIPQPPPSMGEAMRGAWQIRTIRYTTLASFASGFTGPIATILAFISFDLYQLDAFQRSFIVVFGNALGLVMIPVASRLSQRFLLEAPSKIMVYTAMLGLLPALSIFVVLLHPPLWIYIGVSSLVGIPVALVGPTTGVITMMAIPARYRGVGLRVNTPFLVISGMISGVLGKEGLKLGLTESLIIFAPFYVIAAALQLAAATGVTKDIRNARAAALATQDAAAARAKHEHKILVVRGLDVAIEEVQILTGVDLDVREGEIVALVGTNGAGKSTLLRTVCGLQTVTNGAIVFDGEETTYRPTHIGAREGLIYMPGGQGVFPQMTVEDNLTSAAWMIRSDQHAVEEGVERVLDMFPILRERLDTEAGSMSGGEQQMLALGQAFLMQPKLLMIDELSLGLAPAIVEQLLNTIRTMRDAGVTVILVEQSLNVALTIAERAVFMEKGEIKFDGPVEELLTRTDLVRAVFMGGGTGGAVTASRKRAISALDGDGPLLRCNDITVAFGGVRALTGASFDIAAGEVVGIIGPNGAGKTTLFDALTGYVIPESGSVVLGDHDITALTPHARARLGLGRAFQNAMLFPPLTVRETIAVALDRRAPKSSLLAALWAPPVRTAERKLSARVDGFIEMLGLNAYADKFIRELSTGTRRAVEVACQMAAEPKVLLLDEPSSGLAQAEVEALGPALTRIVRETGCGMVVIEHDLNLIGRISDRLIAMELGRVLVTGAPDVVLNDPDVLRSYLSASNDVIDRSGSRIGSVLAQLTDQPATSVSA